MLDNDISFGADVDDDRCLQGDIARSQGEPRPNSPNGWPEPLRRIRTGMRAHLPHRPECVRIGAQCERGSSSHPHGFRLSRRLPRRRESPFFQQMVNYATDLGCRALLFTHLCTFCIDKDTKNKGNRAVSLRRGMLWGPLRSSPAESFGSFFFATVFAPVSETGVKDHATHCHRARWSLLELWNVFELFLLLVKKPLLWVFQPLLDGSKYELMPHEGGDKWWHMKEVKEHMREVKNVGQ